MGRRKKEMIEELDTTPEEAAEMVEVSAKEKLLVRQEELLDLLEVLKKENVRSVGDVEVKLSQVNTELAKLS